MAVLPADQNPVYLVPYVADLHGKAADFATAYRDSLTAFTTWCDCQLRIQVLTTRLDVRPGHPAGYHWHLHIEFITVIWWIRQVRQRLGLDTYV